MSSKVSNESAKLKKKKSKKTNALSANGNDDHSNDADEDKFLVDTEAQNGNKSSPRAINKDGEPTPQPHPVAEGLTSQPVVEDKSQPDAEVVQLQADTICTFEPTSSFVSPPIIMSDPPTLAPLGNQQSLESQSVLLSNGTNGHHIKDDDDDDDLDQAAHLHHTLPLSLSTDDLLLEHPSSQGIFFHPRANSAKQDDGKVPVSLAWEGGGHRVFVAFESDWTRLFPAKRLADGTFEYRARFAPFQIIQFKFVVDGEWLTSQSYCTIVNESKAENNFIVPVCLVWKQAARSVYVCFDFDGWATKHRLRFELGSWVLKKYFGHNGDYVFKFMVDGELIASRDYPTTADDNNIVTLNRAPMQAASLTPATPPSTPPSYCESLAQLTHHNIQNNIANIHNINKIINNIDKDDNNKINHHKENRRHHDDNTFVVHVSSDDHNHSSEQPTPDINNIEGYQNQYCDTHDERDDSQHLDLAHCDLNGHEPTDAVALTLAWTGEAQCVEVWGDHNNWASGHTMTPHDSNLFVLSCRFPPFRPLKFKFVVDSAWLTSPDFPIQEEEHKVNNYVMPVQFEYRPSHHINCTKPLNSQDKVEVVCDVDNWQCRHQMTCVPSRDVNFPLLTPNYNDDFVFVLATHFVVKEKYKFKFIVGGSWCVSSAYQTEGEGEFVNNMIQPKDFEPIAQEEVVDDHTRDYVPVELAWCGAGSNVEVHTDFDGWRVAHPLSLVGAGSWAGFIRMPPMTSVQFKFVVDGDWRTSPDYAVSSGDALHNNVIVPAIVQWVPRPGCHHSQVMLCAETSRWKQHIPLSWDGFRFVAFVPFPPNKDTMFKFIVDGRWVTSDDYETVTCGTMTNNILHL